MVRPSRVRGGFACNGQAVVLTGLARRVVTLERRRLHPAQPLQIREVGNKAMIAAAIGIVRGAGEMPLVNATFVVVVDVALLLLGSLYINRGGSIHG